MEKTSYDTLVDLVDPLFEAVLADYAEINLRRRPVEALHARPPLREIAADPALRAAWIGANATAVAARIEALAPFEAEEKARRARFEVALDELFAAHCWTNAEFDDEVSRRCDASLRASGHLS